MNSTPRGSRPSQPTRRAEDPRPLPCAHPRRSLWPLPPAPPASARSAGVNDAISYQPRPEVCRALRCKVPSRMPAQGMHRSGSRLRVAAVPLSVRRRASGTGVEGMRDEQASTAPASAANVESPAAKVAHLPAAGRPAVAAIEPIRSELVVALVGPVGADLQGVARQMADNLGCYGYRLVDVHLSGPISKLDREQTGFDIPSKPEFQRIMRLMDAGNWVRETAERADILALWAASHIHSLRPDHAPTPKTLYLIRSLKHEAEVKALRRIYGPAFFLVGVHASEDRRRRTLLHRGLTVNEADGLIERDAGEKNKYGQHTREAFGMADVFISQSNSAVQIDRFLRLIFGDFRVTPTLDEHAMFMACASSVRSADLSRQVGAVVWHPHAGVVGAGANDVPRAHGGSYWPGNADRRDYVLGHDANERHRRDIASDIAKRVVAALALGDSDATQKIEVACQSSRLFEITEFGRAVHAEMDALLSCARAGVSTQGCVLFSTTFPCHNCAKHVVSAGISRVVYIEPYPKSQAVDLHGDAIQLDEDGRGSRIAEHVLFQPFEGVGPRRYYDLFSLKFGNGNELRRKGEDGSLELWSPSSASPRVPLIPTIYIERELEAAVASAGLWETSST